MSDISRKIRMLLEDLLGNSRILASALEEPLADGGMFGWIPASHSHQKFCQAVSSRHFQWCLATSCSLSACCPGFECCHYKCHTASLRIQMAYTMDWRWSACSPNIFTDPSLHRLADTMRYLSTEQASPQMQTYKISSKSQQPCRSTIYTLTTSKGLMTGPIL